MPRKARLYGNENEASVYHCVTRTVNKEFLWNDDAKRILHRQIVKVAAFCGVDILSYCIMSNHVHLLVRVKPGQSASLTNDQLLEKAKALYTNPKDAPTLGEIEQGLLHPVVSIRDNTRRVLLARMDNISNYMKILKLRFSIWFNQSHGRWGTHWGERFRSVLVENTPRLLSAVAAYIALNPVRAGICRNPRDYEFSSYAAALAGDSSAACGLCILTGSPHRQEALKQFRDFLQAVGGISSDNDSGGDAPQIEIAPIANFFQQKQKCFVFYAALGSKEFLQQLLQHGKFPLYQG